MNRREALKSVAFLMGSAISATTMGVLFESFSSPIDENKKLNFTATDEAILAEFAEIIIPTTASSPGAKAAGLGTFIPMIIKDCYPVEMQEIFANGLKAMQYKCVKDFNKEFLATSPARTSKTDGRLKRQKLLQLTELLLFSSCQRFNHSWVIIHQKLVVHKPENICLFQDDTTVVQSTNQDKKLGQPIKC